MVRKLSAFALAVVLSGSVQAGLAIADDIANNLDGTVEATLEVLNLTSGGSTAPVGYVLSPTTGGSDPDNGCNLDGAGQDVTFNVVTSNALVASVSPTSISFTGPGCGDVPVITVTPVGAGSATITLTETTNTTGGTFSTSPASFTVNVSAPADVTAPVITPMVTPAANANGWHNTDVNVSWTVVDNESTVTSTTGCDAVVLSDETSGTTLTCEATSSGGTTSVSVTIKIDKTAPTATATPSPLPNTNGWNNAAVTVTFTGEDALSGIDFCDAATVLASEGADQSASGTCTDIAGNVSAPASAENIDIDLTNPEITITTPVDGGLYTIHQVVNADFACSDALSGIDTCTGTVADGSAIDTEGGVGAVKNFTVNATDLAGNAASKTATYTLVGYTFGGFKTPVTISAKDFKKMSTIPVKFTLFNNDGSAASLAVATLKVNGLNAVASGGSNVGNLFRFDTSGQQYIFNLSTKQLSLGSNTLVVTLDDNTTQSITITIK